MEKHYTIIVTRLIRAHYKMSVIEKRLYRVQFSLIIYLYSYYQIHEAFIINKSWRKHKLYLNSRRVLHIFVKLSVFLLKIILYT